MEILIGSAFSLNMLDRETQSHGRPRARIPVPCDDPQGYLAEAERMGVPVRSVVGHADTAAVFSTLLGREVGFNRESVKLSPDQILLVGQYSGPRLPEGATSLPEGAAIEWWLV